MAKIVLISCCVPGCGRRIPEAKAQVEPIAGLEALFGQLPTTEQIRSKAMCGRCAYDFRNGVFHTYSLLGTIAQVEAIMQRRRYIAERRLFFPTTRRGQRRQPTSKAS